MIIFICIKYKFQYHNAMLLWIYNSRIEKYFVLNLLYTALID